MQATYDFAVVGGGIVGLATARELLRARPGASLVLLEKEEALAGHQTGHNSGVIHSGLYYRPGSAKARLCVRGRGLLMDFCREHGVPFEICGKVVVATDPAELPRLEELWRRGTANGVDGLTLLGPEELRAIEPHAAGVQALHVPGAGIVDYGVVCRKLAEAIRGAGGEIRTGARVVALDGERLTIAGAGEVRARYVVACAGLYSDRVARMDGARPGARIVPFRGEYYEVVPERVHLVRGLVYPVPDPRFPFLGVHFTRRVGGGLEAGPNAVLALHREGYTKARVSVRDAAEILAFPGFWRLARRYTRTGIAEMVRSFSKRAFVRALRRLVPEIRVADLHPAPAGVRAQALTPSGELVDDFLLVERPNALHVCNAPSPAATASLAIAEEIVARVLAGASRPT